MNFGEVIEAVKKNPSRKFTRIGWNGKNMFIYLTKGRDVPVEDWRGEVPSVIKEDVMDDDGVVITKHVVRLTDHFDMKAADGTIVCGWLASQTDMFAEDWVEVFR